MRQFRDDRETEARERPDPRRINERAEAMVVKQLRKKHRGEGRECLPRQAPSEVEKVIT